MKNNDIQNDKSQLADERLAEMLQSIEHAGRDNRRQQHLSALIDQMAAEEAAATRRRNRKRWAIAFSAAACIALFITTIVRLTGTTASVPSAGGNLMAGVVGDTIIENTGISDTLLVAPQHAVKKREPLMIASNEVSNDDPSQETEEDTSIEDTIIDILEPEILIAEDIEEANNETESIDIIATPVTSVGNNENVAVQEKQEPAKKPRRFIRLRRSEPSKMDGTMLALRIM